MVPRHTRRGVLRLTAGGAVGALGGCLSTAGGGGSLSFAATMVTQATAETPPRFRASLTNEGSGRVTVGFGQAFLYGGGRVHRDPSGLVVVPTEGTGVPRSPTDGCWVYSPAGTARTKTVRSIARSARLEPGGTLETTFDVYSETTDPCYPAGEHHYRDGVSVGRTDGDRIPLVVTISIDGSGRLSVAGERGAERTTGSGTPEDAYPAASE